jgi:hypothetical protein
MLLPMHWSPLLLSIVTLVFPAFTHSAEFRAPITQLAAYTNLPSCITPVVKSAQALIYGNKCLQTDLADAASCLCSKSANLASYTNDISTYAEIFCSANASEEISSALAVVTEYCKEATSIISPTGTRSSVKG